MGRFQQQKTYEPCKRVRDKKSEKIKQLSEPDSDITQILELSDREFRITVVNVLKALMEKKRAK